MLGKLVVVILLLAGMASAELVSLQNYTIDTGSYMLPVDLGNGMYRQHLGPAPNGEGIWWTFDQKHYGKLIVGELGKDIVEGARRSNITDIAYLLSNDSASETNDTVKPVPVNKPYPGWITSYREKGTNQQVAEYWGQVNEGTIVYFKTNDLNIVDYFLRGLRVIPRGDEGNIIGENLASGLR